MSWDIILDLLAKGESQSLIFLTRIESEQFLAQQMAALANTEGGKIVLGLDNKNGHLIGCDQDQSGILKVSEENCSPPLKIALTEVLRHDKHLLVIDIPEGDDKPYMVEDVCYIREGNSTRVAKSDEEKLIKGYEGDKDINARQKKALAYVQEQGSITNREYRDCFGVSHKTAHIELTHMVNQLLLLVTGSGRSTGYVLPGEGAQSSIFSEASSEVPVATTGQEASGYTGDVFNEQMDVIKESSEQNLEFQ